MPNLNLRVSEDDRIAWANAAQSRGLTTTDLVKAAVAAYLEPPGRAAFPPDLPDASPLLTGQPTPEPKSGSTGARRGSASKARRGACPRARHHRKGVYCRDCGATP